MDGLAAGWKVKEYREHPVPLVLSTVDSDGATAHFRQLFGEHASIQAKPGQTIPGTNWKLITAQRKFGKQKDDGAPLDLSSVTIEFAPGAAPRSLVAGTQGTLDEPIAVLTSQAGSQTLIARRGDTFKIANQPDVIRINDISPDSVVVENLTSRETRTLPRR